MSKLWIVAIMALLAKTASWADGWQVVTPGGDVPSARFGHTMVEINGQVYMFGGLTEGGSVLLDEISSYLPGENRWVKETPINNPPPARIHHASVAYQNRMYVFSGYGDQGILGDVWVYDPATKAWSNMPEPSSHPTPRTGHSAVVVGDRILIYGGKTGADSSKELWSYDPKENMWSLKKSHTLPLSAHRAVTADGKMYIHGGVGETGEYYLYLSSYDIANDTWSDIAIQGDLPSPRAFHILATDGKKIWSTGGKGHDSSGTPADLSDTWELDLTSMKWTQKTDGPAQSMSAAVLLSQNRSIANLIAWTPEEPANNPPSFSSAVVIPKPSLQAEGEESKIFMFAGQRNGQFLNESWLYYPNKSACMAKSITASPKRLTLRKGNNGNVTITVKGRDDCLVEGVMVTAKGKQLVGVSPGSQETDANGQAVFTINAKDKKGTAVLKFKASGLNEVATVQVKVR